MYANLVTSQKYIYPVLFWVIRMVINCTIVLRVFLDFTRDISSILPVFVDFSVLTLVIVRNSN